MSESKTEETIEPTASAGRKGTKMCEHDNGCTTEPYEEAMIAVHFGGIKQDWCPECAERESGIPVEKMDRSYGDSSIVERWVTREAVVAATLATTITALIMSIGMV